MAAWLRWSVGLFLAVCVSSPAAAASYFCRGEAPVGAGSMMMDLSVDDAGKISFSSLTYQERTDTGPPMLVVTYGVNPDRVADVSRPAKVQLLLWGTMSPQPRAKTVTLTLNVNGTVFDRPWSKFDQERAAFDAGQPPAKDGFLDMLTLPDMVLQRLLTGPSPMIAITATGEDQSRLFAGEFRIPPVRDLEGAAKSAIERAYSAAASPATNCRPRLSP